MNKRTKARSAASAPGNESKGVDLAAYRILGGRLGYITEKAIDPSRRAEFEKDLSIALQELAGLNAPSGALAVAKGFGDGYDKAKAGD